MAEAPTLATERLILRAHRVDDHEASAAMWADPVVVRFIGGTTRSSQEAWFRILREAGHWLLLGYGYWMIDDRATGEFLGEGGFADFRRGIPELEGVPEMGWAFVRAAWGRGIASEAVTALLAWADAHLDADETRCIISPGNVASVRVAEKCGFVRFADLDEPDGRSLLFRRTRQG
jgi:RimJ/RimL family protein N-acetyltransferase